MSFSIIENSNIQPNPEDTLIISDDYIEAITEPTIDLNSNDADSFLDSLVYFDGSCNDDDYILSGNIADIFENEGLDNTEAEVQRVLSEINAPYVTDDADSFLDNLVNFFTPYDDCSGNDDNYTLNVSIADIFENAGLDNIVAEVKRILSGITTPYITDVFGDASIYTMPYPEHQPYTITGNTGTPDYMRFINSIIGNVNSTGNNALQVADAMSGAASDFASINAKGLNAMLGYSVGF